jgi:pimeloyl-ACP methyl ester carboxylesterase
MILEEPVSFSNNRGEILKGVVHRPKTADPSKGAILCHGMESNKESEKIVALSNILAERGVLALRFDFSYAGESTGRFEELTYSGEVEDLKAAFNFMSQLKIKKIALFGSSMGGTVSLLFSAQHKTPAALVTLAAPLHPEKITETLLSPEQVKQWRLSGHITYHGRRINSSLLDDLGKINVAEAARKIRCPLLVIHGDRDETVPVEEANELYGLIPSSKRLCILQGSDHRCSNPSLLNDALRESCEWITQHLE